MQKRKRAENSSKHRKEVQVNKPSHVTTGNVFEDLGFSPMESFSLKLKTDLYQILLGRIRDQKLSRRDLEHLLREPQPRVSELMTGKISKMSIEKLSDYLQRLGALEPRVEIPFSTRPLEHVA